jgi:uncharacterized membrane protein
MNKRFRLINVLHFLNILIFCTYIYTLLTSYSFLPDRIPVHFKFDMHPDSWGEKSNLFVLSGILVFLNIVLYTLVFLKPVFQRNPKLLNIPNKKKFLELPLEKQEIYWNMVNELFAGLALILNFLFLNILYGTIKVALLQTDHLNPITIITGVVAVNLYSMIYIIRLLMLPKKLIKE